MTKLDSNISPHTKAVSPTRHRINLVLWAIIIAGLVAFGIWTYSLSRQ
jgi:hypothetical protein